MQSVWTNYSLSQFFYCIVKQHYCSQVSKLLIILDQLSPTKMLLSPHLPLLLPRLKEKCSKNFNILNYSIINTEIYNKSSKLSISRPWSSFSAFAFCQNPSDIWWNIVKLLYYLDQMAMHMNYFHTATLLFTLLCTIFPPEGEKVLTKNAS